MAGKLTPHETLAVAGTAVSPATTAAAIAQYGVAYVAMTTDTGDVRWTCDGQTTPVPTGGSEVGCVTRTTDAPITFTIEEFLNLSLIRNAGTSARVQFAFLAQSRRQDF